MLTVKTNKQTNSVGYFMKISWPLVQSSSMPNLILIGKDFSGVRQQNQPLSQNIGVLYINHLLHTPLMLPAGAPPTNYF